MKLLPILVLFLWLINTGCSTIVKCAYLKPLDKDNNWIIQRNNKKPSGYLPFSTHYYHSCDSISSIRIEFTNLIQSLTFGPPLIPVIPLFFLKGGNYQISISIKTKNDTDVVAISKYIHIIFNDSLTIEPYDAILDNSQREWGEEFHKSICDNQSITNKLLWILYRYEIDPNKVKKITVCFDKELNRKLNSNFKDLRLKRKNRLRYYGFLFPTH